MKRHLLAVAFLFWQVGQVLAQGADITITCPANGPECSMAPNPGAPLFYETNMLPGDTVWRKLTVINQDETQSCNLEVKAYNPRKSPANTDFASRLNSTIVRNGNMLLGNTIQDIYDLGQIDLSTIPPGGTVEYDWTVQFDPKADNYYQQNETVFDFDVVFSCGDERSAKLLLTKTNNRLGLDNSPGDWVIYTLTVKAVTDVNNVKVVDLPPKGFKYRQSSWTAMSDQRGNLKPGVTSEPSYHSPGSWDLGDMKADEEVTLTYIAEIGTDQKPGLYPDLAWASGEDVNQIKVQANIDTGFFVGTDVKVVKPVVANTEYQVKQTGKVLGATTSLPATGANVLWPILGLLLIMAGVIDRNRLKRSAVLGCLLLLCQQNPAKALNLSVRLSQPNSPTNQKNLDLNFVVLDLENQPVDVFCYKKGPGEIDFSQFGEVKTVIPGGTSDRCPETESIIQTNGMYSFKAVAVNGIESVETNQVVVDFRSESPATPEGYSKTKVTNCEYQLEFKTADDNKTTRVEIYRSTNEKFEINDSTKIASIGIGPNQKHDFSDTVPDCNKEYFYAMRSFSSSGNNSGLTGDTILAEQTVTLPQSLTQPLRLTTTETNLVNPPPAEEGQGLVLGDSVASEEANTTPVPDRVAPPKTRSYLPLAMGGLVFMIGILLYLRQRRK